MLEELMIDKEQVNALIDTSAEFYGKLVSETETKISKGIQGEWEQKLE